MAHTLNKRQFKNVYLWYMTNYRKSLVFFRPLCTSGRVKTRHKQVKTCQIPDITSETKLCLFQRGHLGPIWKHNVWPKSYKLKKYERWRLLVLLLCDVSELTNINCMQRNIMTIHCCNAFSKCVFGEENDLEYVLRRSVMMHI